MSDTPFDSIDQAFKAGDLSEAERRIEASWDRLGPWGRLTQPFRLAHHQKNHEEAKRLALKAVQTFPERAYSYDMLALCHLAADRPAQAFEVCTEALARFPDDRGLLRRAKSAARAINRPDDAIGYLRRLLQPDGQDWADHAELGHLLLQTYRGAEALDSFERALERGAPRRRLLVDLAMAAERAARFELAEDYWGEVAVERPEDAGLAREGLSRVAMHVRNRERPAVVVAGLEELVRHQDDQAAVLASSTGDLKAWRRPGATDAVLVFGGLQSMMGVAPPAAPQALIALSEVNIVSFSDARRGLMMSGLPTLGADYAETLASLRRLFEAWGVRRLFVLGYSAGGYPALRYAADLGAKRLLLMSGWIELALAEKGPLLASLVDAVGHMYVPPRDLLARAPSTEVIMAYGDSNARDVAQARTLEGVDRVTLRPLKGVVGHSLALEDAHDALLADLLGT